jgi:hypothetical protein
MKMVEYLANKLTDPYKTKFSSKCAVIRASTGFENRFFNQFLYNRKPGFKNGFERFSEKIKNFKINFICHFKLQN